MNDRLHDAILALTKVLHHFDGDDLRALCAVQKILAKRQVNNDRLRALRLQDEADSAAVAKLIAERLGK